MKKTLPYKSDMQYDFDIYENNINAAKEGYKTIDKAGYKGIVVDTVPLSGINFKYYNLQSSDAGTVMIMNHSPFVQINYVINGTMSCKIQNEVHELCVSTKRQEANFLFIPEDYEILMEWEPQKHVEMFQLGISLERMYRCLPQEHPFYTALEKSVKENNPIMLNRFNVLIQGRVNTILNDMLHCPLKGRYKQLYFKSKFIELLMLELETYISKSTTFDRNTNLKPVDIERMHKVKAIITENIKNPYSLSDLAHMVGTNDAYLKSHFKEVFGTTVFGYIFLLKMQKARELLLEGSTTAEVAEATGYKRVSHFARAFKGHFGLNPNHVKNDPFRYHDNPVESLPQLRS
ncbi:MAG: helix-turn-helix transcriptional regulator [Chitinophagaceae bacterium]|nr:helix-turn-helix transcriptional regulator [Chitinophagaceae bacterium]